MHFSKQLDSCLFILDALNLKMKVIQSELQRRGSVGEPFFVDFFF